MARDTTRRRNAPQRASSRAVTSKNAADLVRLQARNKQAERALRETGDPWKALEVLGIKGRKTGPRGRTRQELEQLASLYVHMTEGGGQTRPNYSRTERLDLLLENAAAWIDYQRDGGERPVEPADLTFTPDCDVPMPPEDALRNVARYLDVGLRQAWEVLHRESLRRADRGGKPLNLPRRPR